MKFEPGKGQSYYGKRRLMVSFDPDQFELIRRLAVQEDLPVSTVVRRLVEWGLESSSTAMNVSER